VAIKVLPASLFLISDGRVKILDFGLAKLTRQESQTRVASRVSYDSSAVKEANLQARYRRSRMRPGGPSLRSGNGLAILMSGRH
jgi:serine/threonine protein kinase